jgi:hypothetical protein
MWTYLADFDWKATQKWRGEKGTGEFFKDFELFDRLWKTHPFMAKLHLKLYYYNYL